MTRTIATRYPYADRDEAWLFAVERALGQRWRTHVEQCLEQCNGNAREALALSRRMTDGTWMNGWGVHGHKGMVIDSGYSRDGGIKVWLHDRRSPEPPDFTIKWIDVFRYARDGTQQLALFLA